MIDFVHSLEWGLDLPLALLHLEVILMIITEMSQNTSKSLLKDVENIKEWLWFVEIELCILKSGIDCLNGT